MQKHIRLNEEDLHKLILESVKTVIRESYIGAASTTVQQTKPQPQPQNTQQPQPQQVQQQPVQQQAQGQKNGSDWRDVLNGLHLATRCTKNANEGMNQLYDEYNSVMGVSDEVIDTVKRNLQAAYNYIDKIQKGENCMSNYFRYGSPGYRDFSGKLK